MTFLMTGLGAGALHAVAGPDHWLSLGPVALAHPRPWRVGLRWGVGHGVGTLLLALPLVLVAHAAAPHLATWGDRLGATALVVMALWTWRALRRRPSPATAGGAGCAGDRSALLVGLVHGVGGAGSLVLFLPLVAQGSQAHTVGFLATFAVGSAVAMAALTALASRCRLRVGGARLARVQRGLVVVAGCAGALWLASTFL